MYDFYYNFIKKKLMMSCYTTELVHFSSIVNEVIRAISVQFSFLQENFGRTKEQIKPKSTNKTKIREHYKLVFLARKNF